MFQQVFFFSIKFTFDQLLCPTGSTSSTSTSATVRSSGTERSTERSISTTFVYYPEKVKREARSNRINDGDGESFSGECTVPLVVLMGVVIGMILVVVILLVLKMTSK